MVITIKKFNGILVVFCFLIMLLLIVFSKDCTNAAIKGIIICGKVIIPSLFPFTVMVLIIIRSNLKLFPDTEFGFILSIIGGYPIGAKITEEIYKKGKITKKGAHLMQCFCVNAGPAFVVSVIGEKILKSKEIGIILMASHILSSLTIKLFLLKKVKKEIITVNSIKDKNLDFNSLFCNSVKDAAASIISVCSFIILFSVINAIFSQIYFLKFITYLFEVTTAVVEIKNIYTISFLLGFAGISIWVQVFSLAKQSEINYLTFVISRISHGILSVVYTFLAVLIFKPSIPIISNSMKNTPCISKAEITVSLIILMIVLILSLENKNNSRKKLMDLLK